MNAAVADVEEMVEYRVSDSGPKRRDAALIYAENRLRTWAKWAKENRAAIGLPTISLLYRAMMQRSVQIKAGALRVTSLTAKGSETPSFVPKAAAEATEAVAEVDAVVAALPKDLHRVIIADYFTYGPIEVRCKQTPWKRARYSQLLESAKYAVFASLSSRSDFRL